MSHTTILNDKAIAVKVPKGVEHLHIEDLRDWEFSLDYKLTRQRKCER